MLCGLLDLPHALEITDGRWNVFDPDAKKAGNRYAKQLRETLQRLDLCEFALFEAVERGARYADLLGDFVCAQAGSEAIGLQPVTDFVIAKRHGCELRRQGIMGFARARLGREFFGPAHLASHLRTAREGK